MAPIDDPAAAVAAGLCLVARSVDPRHPVNARHPRRCTWCDYPVDELRSMVDGFNDLVAHNERRGTYATHEARVFSELPRARQAELVTAAQAFDEPLPKPVAPPADAAEEVVPWL